MLLNSRCHEPGLVSEHWTVLVREGIGTGMQARALVGYCTEDTDENGEMDKKGE